MSAVQDLLSLYRVDRQLRGLQMRLDSAERYLKGQERKLAGLEEDKQELESRGRQFQAHISNLEGEIAGVDDHITKLREQLNRASTDKEYQATLSEVNGFKSKRSELETQALEQMEQVDRVNAEIAALEAQIAEAIKMRDHAGTQCEERHQEVGDRVNELQRERAEAAATIDEGDLHLFDQLADQYDGEAMAQVEEIDRRNREYACGECNLHLPLEAITSLLGSSGSLVQCPACNRILYLQDETRGALANAKK